MLDVLTGVPSLFVAIYAKGVGEQAPYGEHHVYDGAWCQ